MLKIFSIITLILYFFTAFVFFIGKSYFPIIIFLIPLELCILFLLYKKKFFNYIIALYKHTPAKYFFILFIWIIITSLIAVFCGYYSFKRFLIAVIIGAFLRVMYVFLYPIYVVPKIVSIRNVLKIFIGVIFFILTWGIIEFIGTFFNIEIINILVHIFSNIRDLDYSIIIEAHSKIPRIRSIFMEPGVYASFLTINLPIIFKFGFRKYTIFKNRFVNLFVKSSLIPLTILSLILTQSPIYFVFAIITTFFIYLKAIIKFIIKYSIVVLLLSFLYISLIFIILSSINIENTFLIRIVNVVHIFIGKFDLVSLITTEGSLATRVVNNIIQFNIFTQHPIFGIGFGNNGYILINAFRNASIPLTGEMIAILQEATSSIAITTNAFYLLLHQTGIIGFGLYSIFIIKIIQNLKNIKFYSDNAITAFITSLRDSILVLFILSIVYNQGFINNILFLYTSLACIFILIFGKRKYYK